MRLSFKLHLPAIPTDHVILEVKDIGKGKIQLRWATKIQRQCRCIDLLYFIFALGKCGMATPQPGYFTTGTGMVPFCRSWVGPRAVGKGVEMLPHWELIHIPSTQEQVTIPNMLYSKIKRNQNLISKQL